MDNQEKNLEKILSAISYAKSILVFRYANEQHNDDFSLMVQYFDNAFYDRLGTTLICPMEENND